MKAQLHSAVMQNKRAALEQLMSSRPKLHGCSPHKLFDFGIQNSFLSYLADIIEPNWLTIETGCGLSTIFFAIFGTEHICVAPKSMEHDNIKRYCLENGISLDRLKFINNYSQDYLPTMELLGRKLDLALIDGGHMFPLPIIDYYYIDRHLRVGGILIIDDLFIPTVNMLHSYLRTDPSFELITFESNKTGIYRKVAETVYPKDWESQPYNKNNPSYSHLPFKQRAVAQIGETLNVKEGSLMARAYHRTKKKENKKKE